MGTPDGDWNLGRGNDRAPSSGLRNTTPARGGATFFRKALSLVIWLLILAMLISVLKGLDERTFARLITGIRVLRNATPAATQTRIPTPEPPISAEPSPEPRKLTDTRAETSAPDPLPAPPVATLSMEMAGMPEQRPGIAELVLSPARNGNFFVQGEINRQEVTFVVDTGASAVSVPDKLRWKLNLTRGRYLQSATANGITGMYETLIKDLSIGPIRLKNIPALINPNAPDETVLLGMTALREVRMVQQDGRMVLQQEIPQEGAAVSPSPAPPPPKLRKSVKDCMGNDKVIDARVLRCMEDEEGER